MTKIFIGSSVHLWNDPRILHKEGLSLARRYEVELHIPAEFDHRKYKGIDIYGLPLWQEKSDRLAIIWEIARRLFRTDAHIVHLHDPELLPLALLIKLLTSKIVVFDFHEEYSRKFANRNWIPDYIAGIIAAGFNILEGIACRTFNGVIGVIDRQEQVLKYCQNYAIVKNYPVLDSTIQNFSFRGTGSEKRLYNLVYLGDIIEERGIERIVKVAGGVAKHCSITLDLIGPVKEKEYGEFLRDTIEELGIGEQVRFHGYLLIEEAMEILSKGDLGFMSFQVPRLFVPALPVKMFDYMTAGLPVIMPKYSYAKSVVEGHNCGIVVDSMNISETVDNIVYLLENPELRRRLGKNGREAVLKNYSWKTQEVKLLGLYEKMLGNVERGCS